MKKTVSVIGLGHVGLPIACLLATSGFSVRGVDINPRLLQELKEGTLHTEEPRLKEVLAQALKSGNFTLYQESSQADIHLIAVPTLLDKSQKADIRWVHEALEALYPHLRPHNLIIIESTCPVGTTEQVSRELKKRGIDAYLAYCPERIFPGNAFHELLHNHRVVGGVDPQSTEQAARFYESFLKGTIFQTNARTAEAVKLAENAYRDLNIAFANELSMMAEDFGIDAREWIHLANQHPRVNILNPSVGVGGCCIPMDPWYLIHAVPEKAHIMRRAREVNGRKTEWVLEKIRQKVQEERISKVACLGITYKAEVADTRESPALQLVEKLEKEIHVLRVDPFVQGATPLQEAIDQAELIVGLVPHKAFSSIPREWLKNKHVLDFAGCL